MLELQLRGEFRFERRPSMIVPERNPFHLLQGIERANIFVATSGREFAGNPNYTKFVERLRVEFEVRCKRGPQSAYSKWIEVYLP